jgi:hypothetical protein
LSCRVRSNPGSFTVAIYSRSLPKTLVVPISNSDKHWHWQATPAHTRTPKRPIAPAPKEIRNCTSRKIQALAFAVLPPLPLPRRTVSLHESCMMRCVMMCMLYIISMKNAKTKNTGENREKEGCRALTASAQSHAGPRRPQARPSARDVSAHQRCRLRSARDAPRAHATPDRDQVRTPTRPRPRRRHHTAAVGACCAPPPGRLLSLRSPRRQNCVRPTHHSVAAVAAYGVTGLGRATRRETHPVPILVQVHARPTQGCLGQ